MLYSCVYLLAYGLTRVTNVSMRLTVRNVYEAPISLMKQEGG